ncbi:hypothetical protein N7470_005852 [Penicillium chermesinum]|nr:hypothetical protein N7470_005852 [Penicillium chermesinum]
MAQIRPPAPMRSASSHPFESKLSQQLQPEASPEPLEPVSRSPKSRSLSDASKPTTSSQPATGDLNRPPSKDDSVLPTPATPSRSSIHHPNLALNLPSKTAPSPALTRAPLSPKLDSSQIYGSPGSVLPRRSRGLDFSRASTRIPRLSSVPPFSTSGPADRATISSSVSSVNMMESDTSSSEEDDDDDQMMGDATDAVLSTPQASRMGGSNPFAPANVQSPGNDWMGGYSQAAANLMSFQRARFRKGRSRHSSSSGNSSKPSPGPQSPPVMKSVEHPSAGYFGQKPNANAHSRRESLSLGTRDLRLSDLSDDGEGRGVRSGSPTAGVHPEGGPLGVIRRAVTRRSSLLPKTKTFARIRAALMEEGAPADDDIKKEAEVIRQVRDTEPEPTSPTLSSIPTLKASQQSEPMDGEQSPTKSTSNSFSKQASRNSAGVEFWNSFDERYRTPPPARQAPFTHMEDDMAIDMTPSTTVESKPRSRSSTPHAPGSAVGELRRKRRREDDFDPNLFKRRAVSPSVSAHSSPVLTHSSMVDNGPSIWGPPSKLGPPFNPDNGNRTTPHSGTPKRVGLQGMTEASDGFMNMSIDH